MNMRVLSGVICPFIISVITFSDINLAPTFSCEDVVLNQVAEPEAQAASLFRKKKKRIKSSGRMNRHNKAMGKKLKRKNSDTLIR